MPNERVNLRIQKNSLQVGEIDFSPLHFLSTVNHSLCNVLVYVRLTFQNLICPGDDHEEELRKQRDVIENLKQDRTHYRNEAGKLRLFKHPYLGIA